MIVKIKKILENKETKNAGWLITGKIFQILISFIISIFTARFLGPTNYGVINYAAAYVAFFMSLCTLGINSVIIKDFIDFPDGQGETIGTSIFLRTISSFFSAVIIVIISFIVDYGEKETIIVVALSSIALIFHAFDTFNYWFQSKYNSKVTSIATLVAYTFTSIYKIILLVSGASVAWFAFSTSVDYIVLAILLYITYRKHNGPKLSISLKKGKYILSKSYHYILSGMMVAIYGQTDKFMLKQMLDDTSVGYYSLASSINYMWVFILQAIIDSMSPTIMRLYKENKDEFKRKNIQLYMIVIYLSIFVALCFMLFGNIAINIVYGAEYAPAANPLKIICWYTIFSYLGVARNVWLVCENKQKYLKYMYGCAAVVNVILNYILIPNFGANGAAFASLITQVMTCIILPYLLPATRENAKLMIDGFLLKGIKSKK